MSSPHSQSLLLLSQMAKIHPLQSIDTTVSNSCSSFTSSSSSYVTSKREIFTIWMKSLVMQGNGCTVFNQNGDIVYRIDNYDKKGSSDVYLMDFQGKVLVTVLQRNLWFFKSWGGYKNDGSKLNGEKAWFRVKKDGRVSLWSGNDQPVSSYKLEGLASKLDFKIVDGSGNIVAEAKRKQSSSGVLLGDDVLSLVVEPHVDHSFIIALLTVYGLMNQRL